MSKNLLTILLIFLLLAGCSQSKEPTHKGSEETLIVSRARYQDQLYGFWLGQCIANWTGLVTEMDKVGNIGEVKTGAFYTRDNWGQPDLPNIWSETPSDLSQNIDFVLRDTSEVWGADDDTDIEYMYQHLMDVHQSPILSAEQIREGWLKHIKAEEENFLWVSNQRAFDLMREGILPPATSDPNHNEHYDMIDAQLTTELFGLLAPARPHVALSMAHLPIRVAARANAAYIAEFYVVMHALAARTDDREPLGNQLQWMAMKAREHLPDSTYAAKMFDFVKQKHASGMKWEQTRDAIYQRYQVDQMDGYEITSDSLYCNGCFAAGINFAASLVSLFYGEGDLKETIKIGALTGWDSDNPMATWGGLIGFMLGKEGIEKAFGRQFSNRFNIHRTRQHFPNEGIDRFEDMAATGLRIIDRVVVQEMGGTIEADGIWRIPVK